MASRLFSTSLRRLHHQVHHRLAPRTFCTGPPFDPSREQEMRKRVVNGSHVCISLDLPGLSPDRLKVSLDELKNIRFGGKCKSRPQFGEEEGRFYGGIIDGCPSHLEMEQLKVELKHGVLWILIPFKQQTKQFLRIFNPPQTAHPGNPQNSSGVAAEEPLIISRLAVNKSYGIYRVDVPGLTAEDVKVWLDEKKAIKLEGKCKAEPQYHDEGRFYRATIPGCTKLFHMDLIKAQLKHGVIWITVPVWDYLLRLEK